AAMTGLASEHFSSGWADESDHSRTVQATNSALVHSRLSTLTTECRPPRPFRVGGHVGRTASQLVLASSAADTRRREVCPSTLHAVWGCVVESYRGGV